jgi:sodium/pantothenate symporter
MLLSVGAALSYDLARIFKPDLSDKATKTLNISFILIVGVLVMILAMNPPELLTLMYSAAMGLLASSLFWPTMLGLWWKRMNKQGAVACVLGGGATFLICLWGFKLAPLSQVCYSIPVGLVLAVVVSLLTAPSSEKELKRVTIAHMREFDESLDA